MLASCGDRLLTVAQVPSLGCPEPTRQEALGNQRATQPGYHRARHQGVFEYASSLMELRFRSQLAESQHLHGAAETFAPLPNPVTVSTRAQLFTNLCHKRSPCYTQPAKSRFPPNPRRQRDGSTSQTKAYSSYSARAANIRCTFSTLFLLPPPATTPAAQ